MSASAGVVGAPTDSDVYVCLSHALRAWNDRDDVTIFLVHDSGTSAHLGDVAGMYIEGTQEACHVRVYGVNGDENSPLIAHTRGDIEYHLDDGFSVILKGVLDVPDAQICGKGKMAVLVSTKLLARGGVGTHFKEGGCEVEFISGKKVVGRFETEGELYVHARKTQPMTRIENALKALREKKGKTMQ